MKKLKNVGFNSGNIMVISGIAVAVIIGLAIFFLPSYTGVDTKKVDTNIKKELSRLASLNAKGEIKVSDLDQLKSMLSDNPDIQHEMREIEDLISYGEYQHAAHSFAFLASHLETGLETVCPGHELAHYYIYMKHGNKEGAKDKLNDAKEQMETWENGAREFYKKYPGDLPFDYIVDKVKSHLLAIESGRTNTTEDEINFLAEKTVCIQSDAEHGSHEEGNGGEEHEKSGETGPMKGH